MVQVHAHRKTGGGLHGPQEPIPPDTDCTLLATQSSCFCSSPQDTSSQPVSGQPAWGPRHPRHPRTHHSSHHHSQHHRLHSHLCADVPGYGPKDYQDTKGPSEASSWPHLGMLPACRDALVEKGTTARHVLVSLGGAREAVTTQGDAERRRGEMSTSLFTDRRHTALVAFHTGRRSWTGLHTAHCLHPSD